MQVQEHAGDLQHREALLRQREGVLENDQQSALLGGSGGSGVVARVLKRRSGFFLPHFVARGVEPCAIRRIFAREIAIFCLYCSVRCVRRFSDVFGLSMFIVVPGRFCCARCAQRTRRYLRSREQEMRQKMGSLDEHARELREMKAAMTEERRLWLMEKDEEKERIRRAREPVRGHLGACF